MNWADARRGDRPRRALLGTALGGPLGGAAGQIWPRRSARRRHARRREAALPAAEPARVADAEARWIEAIRAEADAQRTAISETQATMRAEIASEDAVQRWWRPLYAFELTFECAALWAVLMHEFWTGDVVTLNAVMNATALFVAYWGFRFGVLGVYISGRTREKVCAATGRDSPGVLDRLVKAVTRTKTG